ncbi:hypothetical protein [Sphingomonas endophytica]|nr:hypothetical protein [Sphingomonas endophytica]
MPNVNPIAAKCSPARSSDMASQVADDMAAIFGESQRSANDALHRTDRPVGALQEKRPRSRLMVATLLGTAGLAAMIGVGVVVGKNAVGSALDRPSARPRTVVARRAAMPAPRAGGETLTPTALPPEAMPDAEVALTNSLDVPASAITVDKRLKQSRSASAPPRLAYRNSRDDGERADVLFRRTPRVIQHEPANPPAAMASGSRADCYGDIDCTNARLYAADGEVARAYAEATSSGVRVRDLRDYRHEWIRARNVAAARPSEALRIYDMVAADLRMLADDAVADDRMAWQ